MSITIEVHREGDIVFASAEGVAVGRATVADAVVDLILAYEAVNGLIVEAPPAADSYAGRSAVHPDGIREIIEEAVISKQRVLIAGSHVDNSVMDERVVEPVKLDGNLLGAYDHINEEFRNFRLDKLTYATNDDLACDRWLGL